MNILIVEDEQLECEALKQIITTYMGKWFQNITIARDGIQAVRVADLKSFDLILMDINLPLLNGLDAAKSIIKKHANAKIIMISAYSDYDHLRESMRNQAVDYITKPYSVATLKEAVQRVLAVGQETTSHGKGAVVIQVKQYIKEHYTENLLLSDISQYVNLDKSYLGRMFKDETGTTIMTYLKRVRLERAKKELLAGQPATEAAIRSGFGELSYFSRYFKQEVGYSPMQYAKSKIDKKK